MVNTILVIDDEAESLRLLCKTIEDKLFYKTIPVDSELKAKNLLLDTSYIRPDIILFDISCINFAHEKVAGIKSLCLHTPIAVLTKYADYNTAVAAIRAGAQDFLSKPVAIERMQVTFQNLIIIREFMRHNMLTNANNYLEMFQQDGHIRSIGEIEMEAISRAMRHYDGCMTEVARHLGIGRSTLYRKINGLNGNDQQRMVS